MIEIPFRFASPEAPLILVPARANGVEFDAVLDTGNAAPTTFLLGARFAQRLGITPKDPEFPLARLDHLELGGQVFADVEVGVLAELDDVGDRGGFSADGNFGSHFIKDWRLEIDYPGKTVRFSPNSPSMNQLGVPFECGANGTMILVPAEVNGRGPYCFALDTGASTSVVSPRLAAELGLSGPPTDAESVLGKLPAQIVQLDSLTTLGRTQRDVSAQMIPIFDYVEQATGRQVDGIVGYDFINDSVVAIDFQARRLALS
jgi:predicted aspartyl protease